MHLPGNVISLDRVDSTNSYCERLLEQGDVGEGTVVVAKNQIEGKGQGRNQWLSEPGMNLTMSWILFPRFLPPDNQFLLNKSIALGILDLASEFLPGDDCKIKWPNDIYYRRSKLGGILINHTLSGSSFDHSIIGIGININQVKFDPSLPNPISLSQVLSHDVDIAQCLHSLINKLESRYELVITGDHSTINQEYNANLLGVNELMQFRSKETYFTGIIREVDHYGRLVIENDRKELLLFFHGEVEMVF
jgi:BirA family transcriptional regulator, biotin operon repressor / biotin---[acetyl-CoA-carboxylase] ligase